MPVYRHIQRATFRIGSLGNRLVFDCNHEEADTRLVLHAILSGQDVVVVSKDTCSDSSCVGRQPFLYYRGSQPGVRVPLGVREGFSRSTRAGFRTNPIFIV